MFKIFNESKQSLTELSNGVNEVGIVLSEFIELVSLYVKIFDSKLEDEVDCEGEDDVDCDEDDVDDVIYYI